MLNALRNSTPIRANLRQAFDPGRATRRTVSRAVLCWIVLGLSLIAGGAEGRAAADQPQPSTTDKVLQETKEAVESTKQYTLQQKESFQKTFQAELAEIQIKIAELQKKTNAASVEARSDLQKALLDLERKKDEARKQFDEVSQSTSSGWNKLKEKLNHTLDELKKSYKDTVSKLP